MKDDDSYWMMIWRRFLNQRMGKLSLFVLAIFFLAGIYAPFLAASKPLVVRYDGNWYFPLFRYLFFQGYYTKKVDIFFNLLIFAFPMALLSGYLCRKNRAKMVSILTMIFFFQMGSFFYFAYGPIQDPAFSSDLSESRQQALVSHPFPSWDFDLRYMTPYGKLNLVLKDQRLFNQHRQLKSFYPFYESAGLFSGLPSLWQLEEDNERQDWERLHQILNEDSISNDTRLYTLASIHYKEDKRKWLNEQKKLLDYEVMPLIRPFHWEDDAGGNESLNRHVPFSELTRINRKDLTAALIFGIRISLVVGILSVSLALLIGLPIGALAGFYGGTFDIIVSRLLEIWDAMPTFFMLLMVIAMTQSKSIFLIIITIGIFGWTTFSRYMRAEFFKQRNLPYIEACRSIGFTDSKMIFSDIFPNAIPPILTLLPFAIMGAITSEAGLSFLGLGDEGSCSWGVLMDEGRLAFPGEGYLLWPPAILLTILLVAIALFGDSFRDALDPKNS